MNKFVCVLLSIFFYLGIFAQEKKIGLVLSGGGADGLAHIGMLKALEEHGIVPTHIAGSSMGALVGGMYSVGYTPQEIEAFFTSDRFSKMIIGQTEEKYRYQWAKSESDPSIVSLYFTKDSTLKAVLPTNLIDPVPIDFSMMQTFAPASAEAKYNFDSLLIPFRCIASDVYAKESVIFKSGNLSTAIRASMSYPFFIKPIKVDGKLLFDGGLYNNFPADVMCSDFNPDFIIGSKVASNGPPPDEDDLYSQIRALLVNETSFDIECMPHEIIEPQVNFGVFDFENAQAAIDSGYFATIREIKNLKAQVYGVNQSYNGLKNAVFTNVEEFNAKRLEYRKNLPDFIIKEVEVSGVSKRQATYAKRVLTRNKRKQTVLDGKLAKRNFFRLTSNQKIAGAYPTAIYLDSLAGFKWDNKVTRGRDIELKFGGNFGSRPISSGFVGVQYNKLGKTGLEVEANAQFGKLYSAGHARVRLDAPTRIPFYIEPYVTFHAWDYFESRLNTLFTDDIPSFIVTQEQIAGLSAGLPIGNRGIISPEIKYYHLKDDYYQSRTFTPIDTTDESYFEGYTVGISYQQNNLDDKQYATTGKRISLSFNSVTQTEEYTPGSTSLDSSIRVTDQSWIQLKLEIEKYFSLTSRIKLGLTGTVFYSEQPFFNNYTSSIIRSSAYQPTPDSKTLFLESFRANQFAAGGIKFIYKFSRNWQTRLEGYIFQPYEEINKEITTRKASYGKPFNVRHTITSATLVYKSPIGPFSASVNYYYNNTEVSPSEENPLTFLFNYGFILFRKKALAF